MRIVFFVLPMCFLLFSIDSTFTQEQEQKFTKEQIAFVKSIAGHWQVEKMIVGGREFRDKVPFVQARIDENGFTFVRLPARSDNVTAKFSEIDVEARQIKLVFTINEKTQRHVIRMEGGKIWLVTRARDNFKLPVSLKPTTDNVCIRLAKDEEKKDDRD